VKDFMLRLVQSSKGGAEQLFRGRDVTADGEQLSFESQTTRVMAAQGEIFGIVF